MQNQAERWKELAELAANEQDADKLMALVGWVLRVGQKELGLVWIPDVTGSGVSDDSDDFTPDCLSKVGYEVVPNWVLSRKIAVSEALVNDRYWCRLRIVVVRSEGAPARERDGECLEIAGFSDRIYRSRQIVR